MTDTEKDHKDLKRGNDDTDTNAHADNTLNTTAETPSPTKSATKRNAFPELMSSKPSKATKTASQPSVPHNNSGTSNFYARHSNRPPTDPRSGLLQYIQNPSAFPTKVIRVTEHTVLIRDLFPKATIHLLLLPRSPAHYNLHPHDAFTSDEPDSFLSHIRADAATAAALASAELSRLLLPTSRSSQPHLAAMDSGAPPPRAFDRDIRVGVHAHPSMSHLHVHVVSRDMHSPALRHRKHYNSFATDFFVPLADYPLPPDDRRRDTAYQNANLRRDLVCWRCGRAFGNRFKALKDHLELEFREWSCE